MIPKIDKTLLGYTFTWEDVVIQVTKLHCSKEALKGEITVKTTLPGYAPHLHQAVFNFSSTRAKAELIKELQHICVELDWNSIIEQLRVYTLKLYRQGEPVIELTNESVIQPPEYFIYPVLPIGQLNLIFGEGGVGKSTLCLLLSLLLINNVSKFGFKVNNPVDNILYLDYETDSNIIAWQLNALKLGNEFLHSKLYYRRCSIPIFEEVETLKEIIMDMNIKIIIVDSVGTACGGNLNEAETANRFALVLRSFNITSLLISHTSKEKAEAKTPYGSIYFWNNSRNIWEIRKVQNVGEDEISIGLFHRKSNISKLCKPIGLKFSYLEDKIKVSRQDIEEVEEFHNELPLRTRIINLIKSEGLLTSEEIAERLNKGLHVIRARLHELKKKDIIINVKGKWAYKADEPF